MSDAQSADSGSRSVGAPIQIRQDRLLLVEGESDVGFLRALLSRHGRAGVQIEALGGKGNYTAKVRARALAPGFDQVRWLGLARDADNDAYAAFDSMRHAIRRVTDRLPLNVPTRPWETVHNDGGTHAVTLIVFPDGSRPGDLERFIWDALKAEPEAPCIDQYVQCLRQAGRDLPQEWKTRVYAFLSSRARPDMPLSAAARAAELPTDSPVFRTLVDLFPADE